MIGPTHEILIFQHAPCMEKKQRLFTSCADWSRPEGEVSLVAVLKEAERRRTFSPVNRPETGQLLWAEKEALLQAAGCLEAGERVASPPILMEAVGECPNDGESKRGKGKPAVFFWAGMGVVESA